MMSARQGLDLPRSTMQGHGKVLGGFRLSQVPRKKDGSPTVPNLAISLVRPNQVRYGFELVDPIRIYYCVDRRLLTTYA